MEYSRRPKCDEKELRCDLEFKTNGVTNNRFVIDHKTEERIVSD